MLSTYLQTNITIRPFAETDRQKLKEIYLLCRIQTFYWHDADQFQFDDLDADTVGEEIQVAMLDDQIVGFISVWPPDSFIHHLYVDAAYRAGGIGKALLAHAMKNYPSPLKLKCLVKNEAAFSFYRSHEWEVIEEGSDELGDYYLMESK